MKTRVTLLSVLLLAIGCSEPLPDTPEGLVEVAVASQAAAEAARLAEKPGDAQRASDRAGDAAAALEKLAAAQDPPDEAVHAAAKAARTAAGKAKKQARLADEDERFGKLRHGFKAKAYSKAKPVALLAVLKALSFAARQTGKAHETGGNKIPEAVREQADAALGMAVHLTDRPPLADGMPDWVGIADDFDTYATKPPPSLDLMLFAGFALTGRSGLALVEAFEINPSEAETEDERNMAVVLRALALSLNDMPLLAVEELRNLEPRTDAEAQENVHTLAAIHLFMAYAYFQGGDMEAADVQIVKASRLWPNNPVTEFLTGEILAANGQTEQAAFSLESYAKGRGLSEEVAAKIAQRARDLRDGKEGASTLLHDKLFLADLFMGSLRAEAERSPRVAKMVGWLDSAKAFGRRITDRLPGG